jgi:hypothetical protein
MPLPLVSGWRPWRRHTEARIVRPLAQTAQEVSWPDIAARAQLEQREAYEEAIGRILDQARGRS